MATNANLLIGDGFCVRGDGHPDTVLDGLLFPLLKKARLKAGIPKTETPSPKHKFKIERILNHLIWAEISERDSWVCEGFSDYRDYEYRLNDFGNDIYWRKPDSSFWATRRMYESSEIKQLKIR